MRAGAVIDGDRVGRQPGQSLTRSPSDRRSSCRAARVAACSEAGCRHDRLAFDAWLDRIRMRSGRARQPRERRCWRTSLSLAVLEMPTMALCPTSVFVPPPQA
jgi:hypothetical protein